MNFKGLGLALCCVMFFILYLTVHDEQYKNHYIKISLVLSLILCTISLMACIIVKSSDSVNNDISPAGLYSIYLVFIILLYTVVPLPLYLTLLIGILYSIVFESLLCYVLPERTKENATIIVNILLHICAHVVGIHTLVTTQVSHIFI